MLPTVLSDALCSLTQNDTRFALRLSLTINDDFEIVSHKFDNCAIRVKKNLRYDTPAQENNKDYKMIFGVIKKSFVPPQEMPEGVKKFLKNWNSSGGRYSKDVSGHDMLELDAYVHMTSPIRRLVDMLNMMIMLEKCGSSISEKARAFYTRWTSDSSIEYINTTMRSIRKVQNDCSLLKICMDDPTVQAKVYEGYIFDKLVRNDALYQYMVYLPEINMVNRFTSRYDKNNLSKQEFKIYIFIDQHSLKRKIRVEVQ